MTKRKIGILLVALGLILLAAPVLMISTNMNPDSYFFGKINSYVPPFYGHGLLTVAVGILGVCSFLGGLFLLALSKYE